MRLSRKFIGIFRNPKEFLRNHSVLREFFDASGLPNGFILLNSHGAFRSLARPGLIAIWEGLGALKSLFFVIFFNHNFYIDFVLIFRRFGTVWERF